MPWYELFCLARPQLARVQQAELLKTAASAVFNGGGVVADLKSFGERRLAYDVREAGNKWSEAFMWQVTFIASPKVLPDLEHSLKVDERVLRHILVKKDPFKAMPSTATIKRKAMKTLESSAAS